MRLWSTAALMAPFLLLSGCVLATLPTGDASAVLVVRNRSDTKTIQGVAYVNASTCKGMRSLGQEHSLLVEPRPFAKATIPAGKDFSLSLTESYSYGYPTRTTVGCTATGTFFPEAGRRYQVEVISSDSGCVLEVLVESGAEGNTSLGPEPSFRPRQFVERFGGGMCLP